MTVITKMWKDEVCVDVKTYDFPSEEKKALLMAAAIVDHVLMVRPDWKVGGHPTRNVVVWKSATVTWLYDPESPGDFLEVSVQEFGEPLPPYSFV